MSISVFLFAISREALTVMLIVQSKKKIKVKETGIARCTSLLNDQTLDKVDSDSDFSFTESVL